MASTTDFDMNAIGAIKYKLFHTRCGDTNKHSKRTPLTHGVAIKGVEITQTGELLLTTWRRFLCKICQKVGGDEKNGCGK
eukprot:m.187375 g.187375  ORF g.187375 m.187375 type:complete len:80 (+) comp32302_c1_seq4:514-753(+)